MKKGKHGTLTSVVIIVRAILQSAVCGETPGLHRERVCVCNKTVAVWVSRTRPQCSHMFVCEATQLENNYSRVAAS